MAPRGRDPEHSVLPVTAIIINVIGGYSVVVKSVFVVAPIVWCGGGCVGFLVLMWFLVSF